MNNFDFVGWCRQDNHDKVWIMIDLGSNQFATVWGRRGRSLQFKIQNGNWLDRDRLISGKRRKGYREISRQRLHTVYPEFQQDLEKTEVWIRLSA